MRLSLIAGLILASCSGNGASTQQANASNLVYFDPPLLEFGQVKVRIASVGYAMLFNRGQSTFHVDKIEPMCGCTVVLLADNAAVNAGDRLNVPIQFIANGRNAQFKAVRFRGHFDGQASSSVRFSVDIHAVPAGDIVAEPPRLVFERSELVRGATRDIRIHHFVAADQDPVHIDSIHLSVAWLEVRHTTRQERVNTEGIHVVTELYTISLVGDGPGVESDDATNGRIDILLSKPSNDTLSIPVVVAGRE